VRTWGYPSETEAYLEVLQGRLTWPYSASSEPAFEGAAIVEVSCPALQVLQEVDRGPFQGVLDLASCLDRQGAVLDGGHRDAGQGVNRQGEGRQGVDRDVVLQVVRVVQDVVRPVLD